MTVALHARSDDQLLVILSPSSIDAALRAALERAAAAIGLTLLGETLPATEIGGDADVDILICVDAGRHHSVQGRRVVVLSADPEAAAQNLTDTLGLSARDALIEVSRCYDAARSAVATGAPYFWAEDFLERPLETLDALFHALGVSVPANALTDIHATFGNTIADFRRATSAKAVTAPFLGTLAMYRKSANLAVAAAWWDRSLFRWGDHPELECPESLDVTGPARMIAFGPFITLPVGRWRAEVHLDVCEDAARRFYLVEFGVGADLSRRSFRIAEASVDLGVEHDFTAAAPAEIRFWIARAAFHGALGFRGVKITRCGGE